jgi:phage gp36-like protein
VTYATRADLEARYAQDIADRELVLPVLGVDNALADASAEIDSYLGTLFAVPITPVPANLLRMACVIARYRILGDAATEVARRDYEDARSFLRDVAAGRARLDGADTLAASGTAGTVALVTEDRVFSRAARA